MPSVMPLSMIARRKPCTPIWVPSTGPMPPFVQVAEWPDGTKIWRVMDDLSLSLIVEYITQESPAIDWSGWGYETGRIAMFAVTVTFDGHDIPVGYFNVSTYDTIGVPALHDLKVRDPMRSIGVYLDDSIKGVTGIAPRRLGHQVAWFLLEALRVDPDIRSNATSHDSWIRLGIPSPIADRFFDERTYRWGDRYQEALQEWRAKGRFEDVSAPSKQRLELKKNLQMMARRLVRDMMSLEEGPDDSHGPFRFTRPEGELPNAMKFQIVTIDNERFDVTLHLSAFKAGVWAVTWSMKTGRMGGTFHVPLQTSEISLMDALKQSGIILPESTYENWLDEHLPPGHVDFCPSTLEAYDLLGVPTPLLLAPQALWAMVRESP